MSEFKLRTDPARVRVALAMADEIGMRETCRRMNIEVSTMRRWRNARAALGPDWPGLELDRAWIASAAKRERKRNTLARYRKMRYLNGGQLLRVPAMGVHRRLKALHAIGWTGEQIALHGPWETGDAIHELRKRTTVTRENHDIVAAIYDLLCMTPGPSDLNRLYAAKQGWPPPLAWDDIDDPNEVPTLGRDKHPGGGLPSAELLAEWEQLTEDYAFTEAEALATLGVTADAIRQAKKRRDAAEREAAEAAVADEGTAA